MLQNGGTNKLAAWRWIQGLFVEGGGEKKGIEGIVVGILGNEGMLGSGGGVGILGILGIGGTLGIGGNVGCCGIPGIEGKGGNVGNRIRWRAASPSSTEANAKATNKAKTKQLVEAILWCCC